MVALRFGERRRRAAEKCLAPDSAARPVLRNHDMKRTVIAAALAASVALAAPLLRAAGPSSGNDSDAWWRHAVIYEIYPQSFQDSDGDGVDGRNDG